MTKKLMRGLVPVMVLSAAVALFTGCGSKDSGADSKPAGDSKETQLRLARILDPRELLPRIL